MLQQNPQSIIDQHVFLVGRPPIGEFLGFIRTMAVDGQSADQGSLTEEWRRANDHVMKLEKAEAGFADNPSILPIPQDLEPLAQQAKENPIFQRAFGLFPSELAVVELDRLVVFQKHINLAFIECLKAILGPNPTSETVIRLALALERYDPPVPLMQTAQNSYSFISPSNDFRFLEATLLRPDQITNYSATGPVTAILGLAVGYGSNCLNAFHIEGRLVLNNGSHRAFALRDLGITHAPCLIQKVLRREELDLVGIPDLQQNPDRYLKATRPPLLKDYFDPLLRKVVGVPRKNRLVKVSFGIEPSDIPVA